MRHSWSRRTPMKLISEGPPSYRGSASSCCNTIRSACRHHCPRRLRSATAGYREQLSVRCLEVSSRLQNLSEVVTSGQCVGVVRSKLPFAINQDGPEQLLGVLEFTTSLQHVGQAMTGGQAGPV